MTSLIFFIGSIFFIIFGVFLCLNKKKFIDYYFLILLFSLPFPNWSITLLSRDYYISATKGIEIHLADLAALVIGISIVLYQKSFQIKWFPPLTLAFLFYLLTAILSWISAASELNNPNYEALLKTQDPRYLFTTFDTRLYPLFEISKIIRTYFIFWVSVNYFIDEKKINHLIRSLPAILIFYTSYALYERYGLGVYRVSAGLGHPNVFNAWTGMLGALTIPFAFLEKKLLTSLWYFLGIICTLAIIVLTVSRSSLAAYLLTLFIGTLWGLIHYFKAKNLLFVGMGMLLFFAIFTKSFDTLVTRFIYRESITKSQSGRNLLNEEAVLMVEDHPFGVGIGNFSAYSIAKYAKILDVEIGTMAHNIWYLTLAEMGYLGLFSLILLWILYYKILFYCYRKSKDPYYKALLMGIFLSLIIFQFQNMYHFTYRITSIIFFAQILLGITVRSYLGLLYNQRNKLLSLKRI